jgi:Na+/H+ antiporter NhaC
MIMSYGLIAVIIVIGIVIGAIATKKCEPFLIGGSIIGAIFLYKQDFITEWVNTLEGVMSDEAYLILVCGLFGSIIALLTASKGHFGFAKIVSKICNSERKTLFTTFILGVIIFIDDYLNVLSIGTAMKKVYDKVKVPREALAYLLDSTGSPVCVMFPFSSWAAYFGAIFFAQESVQALGAKTWMGAYIKAIPFCIYPIVALLIVILFSAGVFPKLGGMKKAYERVATTGKVYSDASKKYNMDDGEGEQDGNIFNFLVPMLVLVVVACVTGNLVVAQIICLAVTLVMYLVEKLMTFTEYWENFVKGFADMLPIIILLIAALTFQTIASQMQMTEFFIDITQPILSAKIFPMLAFIITGILAFMIANAWGVCTLVAPVLLPLGASVGASAILIMAAILSGCAFGNHACFYCDTTVLASQGSGIDNFDHAVSQLPYVLIGAGISIIGFLVLGFVM